MAYLSTSCLLQELWRTALVCWITFSTSLHPHFLSRGHSLLSVFFFSSIHHKWDFIIPGWSRMDGLPLYFHVCYKNYGGLYLSAGFLVNDAACFNHSFLHHLHGSLWALKQICLFIHKLHSSLTITAGVDLHFRHESCVPNPDTLCRREDANHYTNFPSFCCLSAFYVSLFPYLLFCYIFLSPCLSSLVYFPSLVLDVSYFPFLLLHFLSVQSSLTLYCTSHFWHKCSYSSSPIDEGCSTMTQPSISSAINHPISDNIMFVCNKYRQRYICFW